MNTVFYKKVGRRYQPISEYDSELCDAFPQGAHLLVTKPGSRSIQYRIDPALAPMIAAGRYAQDAMADSIRKATELRPHNHEMSEAEQAKWKEFIRTMPDEFRFMMTHGSAMSEAEQAKWKQFIRTMPDEFRFMMTHGSAMDAVFAGIKAMEQEADKMLSNPAVRKAYDNFMLMYKLTKEEEQ